jgi:hypothetical protein
MTLDPKPTELEQVLTGAFGGKHPAVLTLGV